MKKEKVIYNFNGGWTSGEARRQIGIKNTEKVFKPKKDYSRKVKHKSKLHYDD